MITYQYGPFQPEDENEYTPEKIMSLLSDMIMKYDISLEEALKNLIARGVPVNIFLKEGGMEDLVRDYFSKIQNQIEQILSSFDPYTEREKLYKQLEQMESDFSQKPEIQKQDKNFLTDLFRSGNIDPLRRLKWDSKTGKNFKPDEIDSLIGKKEILLKLDNGLKKYKFSGNEILSPEESLQTIKTLNDLSSLAAALLESLENGDLYNFNLEKIAKYLGAESYQEFLETRDAIFEKLKEILQEKGLVQENSEGGLELTGESIRKIGSRALQEIFSVMKQDSSSGSHTTREFGDSENILSSVKPFEYGDNVSHIDYPGSITNSIIRGNKGIPGINDLDVHHSLGTARSATVILLDMSGSMYRYNRFYNAKKMCLALDALVRKEYKDDKLTIVGFGSTTEIIPVSKMPAMQPYPVTIYDPHIRLVYDFAKLDKNRIKNSVPLYFTNLQKGLNTARLLLSSKQTRNKNIILITDGVPTAHFRGSKLHLNYPPTHQDFDEALTEVKKCRGEGIVINTFLLTSDWEDFSYNGESFIQKFAKISQGRFFYPHPGELHKIVLFDFIENKKRQFSY